LIAGKFIAGDEHAELKTHFSTQPAMESARVDKIIYRGTSLELRIKAYL
jgi:hypothetical protein